MALNPILEVLHTPELVALILSHLDAYTLLLTAPLVSSTWHRTILTTPVLQEKLFFRPSLTPQPLAINHILRAAFPAHFQSTHVCFGAPLFRNQPWAKNPDAFKRKEASWRKMLLWNGGDPEKMKKVKVVSTVQQMSGFYGQTAYLEFEEGLRMGTVWDITRNACQWDEKGQCAMKWDYHLLPGKENVELAVGIGGELPRTSFLERMRGFLGGRRRPFETRYLELGNRVESSGGVEKEERGVLEIWLSTYMTCVGRDIFDPPPPGLGEEFKSEGYERVELEYGDVVDMPEPLNGAAFRAVALRRRNRIFRIHICCF